MKLPVALAIAAIAAPVLVAPRVSAQTIVAIEGQAAPDGNGVISFISGDFGLNNFGEVSYEVQYTGLSDGRVNEKAIIVADGVMPDRTVARGGFTVPQDGFKGLFNPRINDAGEVVFLGFINDPAGGDANRETLFLASATNAYTEIARQNTDFPGYMGSGSPAWYRDFTGSAIADYDIAESSRAVFSASLTIGFNIDRGVFNFAGGQDNLVTLTGQNDLGIGLFQSAFWLEANGAGDFAADISTTSGGRGIVSATIAGGDTRTIIQNGDVFDGMAIAGAFEPSINAARDVAFRVNFSGGARAIGYYEHATGMVMPLVSTGDAAPGGGTFEFLSTPRINDWGVVAFVGRVAGDFGVYTYDVGSGVVERLIGEGDALGGSTITSIGTDMEFNNAGQAAVDFRLDDGRDGIAVTAATAAPCLADVTTDGTANGVPDGAVTLSDFSFYLSLWGAGDAAADLTTDGTANGVPDGAVTLSDFSFYLALWGAGCP